MPYIELPPEAVANTEPDPEAAARSRRGRPTLSPKRAWRREGLMKHLVEPTVVAETASLLEEQAGEIYEAFKPRNGWQDWLTGTIATLMLRINRSERVERKLRDYASYRAIDFWADDQKLAVETIALKIAKEPARVVAKLRETPAGIDWLIARWRILARFEPSAWTEGQRELAAQLVGGDSEVDPSRPGFAAESIAALEVLRERVREADAIVRGLVEADLHDDGVPGLAKLRRYVRSLHRQLKWYVDQFHVEHPDRWDDPQRRPAIYGPVVEKYRPRNPNQFEGKPEPHFDETKPFAVADLEVAPQFGETNPISAPSSPRNDETKPLSTVASPAPVLIEPTTPVHDYSSEKGRNHSRPHRAGEPSRDYARRQKAARRRTNLALAEMS